MAGGGIHLLDDAASGAKNVCSFSPDTEVATPDGARPIADLDVGDQVIARDERTGATSVRPISAVLRHDDPVTGTVVIDGESIETTPEHPFFSLDRGFVPAAELRLGELVATASGQPGTVSSVRWDGGPAEMWNLTVAVDHTFFVGDTGVWVHNACTGGRVHGNSGQNEEWTELYDLRQGPEHLKFGISRDRLTRYPSTTMQGRTIDKVTEGPRQLMKIIERALQEGTRGRLAREPWAGRYDKRP